MEGGEVRALPEDLVERILAMLPFPFVFKARALSKSWLVRFSKNSYPRDEEKDLATSFQKQLGAWTTGWQTFSPVFLGKEDFIAYDRASRHWRRMPMSLSFLPQTRYNLPVEGAEPEDLFRFDLQIEGALLLVDTWPEMESNDYVANILTGNWKELPPRPWPLNGECLMKRMVYHSSSEMYKVIVFNGGRGHLTGQIYDSKSNTWIRKNLSAAKTYLSLSPPVYLNGVLYMLADQNSRNLLAFDVNEGTFEELELPPIDKPLDLVACNGCLLMVVYDEFYTYEGMILLKIDLESRSFYEVTRGPPAALNVGSFIPQPVSGGDCVFFRVEKFGGGVLEYNIDKDEWSCFPFPDNVNLAFSARSDYEWSLSSFQPGLNPFMAV